MRPDSVLDQEREIRRSFDLLCPEGGIVELRATGAGRPIRYGYYDDAEAFVRDVLDLQKWGYGNIYTTFNEVNPQLRERSANVLSFPEAGAATGSGDILSRRYFLIDCDPVRPKGVAASEQERAAARERANAISRQLAAGGWPEPALLSSGNGVHMLYRVDLQNNEEVTRLINRALEAISALHSDDVVQIDVAVGDPSRLTRVAGAVNRKANDSDDRPNTVCSWLDVPPKMEVVRRELLTHLADVIPELEPAPEAEAAAVKDVRAYVEDHGFQVLTQKRWNKGTLYTLDQCPWNAEHGRGTPYVIQFDNGGFDAGCHHLSCKGRGWYDLRRALEPAWEPPAPLSPAAATKTNAGITVVRLADVEFEEPRYLYPPYLPMAGCSALEGDPGVGKSTLVMDLAAQVTTGSLSGNLKGVPAGVLIFATEDRVASILKRRATACGADQSRLFVVAQPVSVKEQVSEIERLVRQHKVKLVVFDPLVAYLGGRMDMNKANEVRAWTQELDALAVSCDCGVIFVRHWSKGEHGSAIHAGVGSVDFGAVVRSMVIVAEDPEDRSRRVMAHAKSNWDQKGDSLTFKLVGGGIQWIGKSNLTAQELIGMPKGGQRRDKDTEHVKAVAFLRGLLCNREVAAKDVAEAAKKAFITTRALTEAKKALCVESKPKAEKGRRGAKEFCWSIPGWSGEAAAGGMVQVGEDLVPGAEPDSADAAVVEIQDWEGIELYADDGETDSEPAI